jgi:hypothetical protein
MAVAVPRRGGFAGSRARERRAHAVARRTLSPEHYFQHAHACAYACMWCCSPRPGCVHARNGTTGRRRHLLVVLLACCLQLNQLEDPSAPAVPEPALSPMELQEVCFQKSWLAYTWGRAALAGVQPQVRKSFVGPACTRACTACVGRVAHAS